MAIFDFLQTEIQEGRKTFFVNWLQDDSNDVF